MGKSNPSIPMEISARPQLSQPLFAIQLDAGTVPILWFIHTDPAVEGTGRSLTGLTLSHQ